jgi:hypothetical protein
MILLAGTAGTAGLTLAHLAALLSRAALLGSTLAALLTRLSTLTARTATLTLAALTLSHATLLLATLTLATLALSTLALAALTLTALALTALTLLHALAALTGLTALLPKTLLARPIRIFIRHRNFLGLGDSCPPVGRKLILVGFVPESQRCLSSLSQKVLAWRRCYFPSLQNCRN